MNDSCHENLSKFFDQLLKDFDIRTQNHNRTKSQWYADYYLDLVNYLMNSIRIEVGIMKIPLDVRKIAAKKTIFRKSGYDKDLYRELTLFIHSEKESYDSHCGITKTFSSMDDPVKIMETVYAIVKTYKNSYQIVGIIVFTFYVVLLLIGSIALHMLWSPITTIDIGLIHRTTSYFLSIDDSIQPVQAYDIKCCTNNSDFTMDDIRIFYSSFEFSNITKYPTETCWTTFLHCTPFVNSTYHPSIYDWTELPDNERLCFPQCEGDYNDTCTTSFNLFPSNGTYSPKDMISFSHGYNMDHSSSKPYLLEKYQYTYDFIVFLITILYRLLSIWYIIIIIDSMVNVTKRDRVGTLHLRFKLKFDFILIMLLLSNFIGIWIDYSNMMNNK